MLSKNFSLDEMTASQTASRRGIDNTPSAEIIENLKTLCITLEEVKDLLEGKAILISSGYRCPKLNSAVGGSKTSSHMEGLAADFTAPRYGSVKQVCEAIRDSDIAFDQLIFEYGAWCHIGVGGGMRRQVLTINNDGRHDGIV